MLFRIWDPPAAPAFPAASELSIPCRDAAGHPMELGLGDEILAGHLLLTGGTGTGKTCFLKVLSDRCRSRFPDANFVFLDPKGDFWPARHAGDLRVTFDPGQDVFQWNILDEVLAAARPEEELDEIIQKLFAPMIQSAGANRFFIQAACQVFYGYLLTVLRRCRGGSVPAHRELAAWLSQSTLPRLRDRLALESDLAGIRTCLEGREAAAVAAELHQFAHTFFCGPGDGHDTIAGFLARPGQALFLEYDAARAESSRPLLRLLLDRAISAILSSRWDGHRVFFFLDEASLLTDYGLERLLNIGRSRGARVAAAFQSHYQVQRMYAQSPSMEADAQDLLAGFSSLIAFRPNTEAEAAFIREQLGQVDIQQLAFGLSRWDPPHSSVVRDCPVTTRELFALRTGQALVRLRGCSPIQVAFSLSHQE